jgi:hypothetical protein
MLWKNQPNLWKTALLSALARMAQIAAVGNSFSARIALYSLGIGRLFG